MAGWLDRLARNKLTLEATKDKLQEIRSNLREFIESPASGIHRAAAQEAESMMTMAIEFVKSTMEAWPKKK